MKRLFLIALFLGFNTCALVFGQTDSLVVDLIIPKDQTTAAAGSVAGTLILKNTGDKVLTLEHPLNRMATTFIVLNSLGNVVKPEGLAKVDRENIRISIQPHSEFKLSFERLEFLSGSALFGFTLNAGENYRIMAIYRPLGEKESGLSSPERLFPAK